MIGSTMQRPERRGRSPLVWLTCGCAGGLVLIAVACVSILLLFPTLFQDIALRVAGFTPQGETEELFVDILPAPTIELEDATAPDQVTVDLGQFGDETFNNNNPRLYEFNVGSGTQGQVVVASFTEQGLNEICRQRTPYCSANPPDPRIRNARIDLRPGGAIVYVDVTVPELGQTITPGVVMRWDPASRRVVYSGIDLNGMLYTNPPTTLNFDFAGTVANLEREANNVLNQLTVNAGGGVYRLSEARINDNTLTLILR